MSVGVRVPFQTIELKSIHQLANLIMYKGEKKLSFLRSGFFLLLRQHVRMLWNEQEATFFQNLVRSFIQHASKEL